MRVWLTVINVLLVGMAGVDAPLPRCTCNVRNLATCSAVNQDSPTSRVVRSYRPHGSLARLLYDKQKADEQLEAYDKTQVNTRRNVTRLHFQFNPTYLYLNRAYSVLHIAAWGHVSGLRTVDTSWCVRMHCYNYIISLFFFFLCLDDSWNIQLSN